MIGQTKVLENIKRIANGNFPRFSIICGQKHGGKKLIAKEIAKTLNAQLISTCSYGARVLHENAVG